MHRHQHTLDWVNGEIWELQQLLLQNFDNEDIYDNLRNALKDYVDTRDVLLDSQDGQ